MSEADGLQMRSVTSQFPCPKCGSEITNREMSLPGHDAAEPRWVLASRRCLSGCSLIGVQFDEQ